MYTFTVFWDFTPFHLTLAAFSVPVGVWQASGLVRPPVEPRHTGGRMACPLIQALPTASIVRTWGLPGEWWLQSIPQSMLQAMLQARIRLRGTIPGRSRWVISSVLRFQVLCVDTSVIYVQAGSSKKPQIASATNATCNSYLNVTYSGVFSIVHWPRWTGRGWHIQLVCSVTGENVSPPTTGL